MTRFLIFCATVCALAARPAAAAAKELQQVQVCGASGCKTITDRPAMEAMVNGGQETTPPPAAPFYRVLATIALEPGKTDSWSSYYVPSARSLRGMDGAGQAVWLPVGAESAALFKRAVGGLEPFPKPTLTSVTTGKTRVTQDLDSYLRLYSIASREDAVPQEPDWIPVVLRSAKPSPWTDGAPYLVYSPSANLIQRGSEFVRLSDGTAARVEQGRALTAGGGLPWRAAGLALAALAALVAIVVLGGIGGTVVRRHGAMVVPRQGRRECR